MNSPLHAGWNYVKKNYYINVMIDEQNDLIFTNEIFMNEKRYDLLIMKQIMEVGYVAECPHEKNIVHVLESFSLDKEWTG